MTTTKTFLFLSAAVALASAQCDPPESFHQDDCSDPELTDVTCPSAEEANNTAVTYMDCGHCSQYWECWNGCVNGPLVCEDGYLYDPMLGCNYAEDVTCGDRDCDGQPCSTAPTDKPIDDYDCPSDGTFPYEDNCIKYILCSNDVAVEQICPIAESTGEQELWCEECDDGNGWCDYPENVDCGDRPICDENDENCEMQPTEAPTPCDEVPCGDSTEYIELGPCEECYCECSGGNVYYLCCADGLFYNPDTGLCDWDYNNPGCD